MESRERRLVKTGRQQLAPLSVPAALLVDYQPQLGHVATLLWINLAFAARAGESVDFERLQDAGFTVTEAELSAALERLEAAGLLEEVDGCWVVHEPGTRRTSDFQGERAHGAPGAEVHQNLKALPLAGARTTGPVSGPAPRTEAPRVEAQRSEPRGAEPPRVEPEHVAAEKPARVMRSPLSKKRSQSRLLKLVDEHADVSNSMSEDMQAVVHIYHKRIGMLGPTQYEKLRFWVEEQGMEGAVVALAIEETVASADVPRISYLEGILRNWYNDGIRRLADIGDKRRVSKVLSTASEKENAAFDGVPNAAAYESVSSDLVAKWKELYPDEYDA